jgi:hypothetical protein
MSSSKTDTTNNTERNIPARSIDGNTSFPPKDFQFQTPRAIRRNEIQYRKDGQPVTYTCRCRDTKRENAEYKGLETTSITGCDGEEWNHADLFNQDSTGYIFMHHHKTCKTGTFDYVLCKQEGCCAVSPTVVPTEKTAIIYHVINEHLSYLQKALRKPDATKDEIKTELYEKGYLFYDKKMNRWLLERPVFESKQPISSSKRFNGKERATEQPKSAPSVDTSDTSDASSQKETKSDVPKIPLWSSKLVASRLAQPVAQSVAQPVAQFVAQPVAQSVAQPVIALETNVVAEPINTSDATDASVLKDAFTVKEKRQKKKNPAPPQGPSLDSSKNFAGRKKIHEESTQQPELSLADSSMSKIIEVLMSVQTNASVEEIDTTPPFVQPDVISPAVQTDESLQQSHTIIEIPEEPSPSVPPKEIFTDKLYLEKFCNSGSECRNKDFKEGKIPCAFNHRCTQQCVEAGQEVPIGFCKWDRPFAEQATRCKNKFCTFDHSKGRVAFIRKQQEYEKTVKPIVSDANGDVIRKKEELEERMKILREMKTLQDEMKQLEDLLK